MNQEEIMRQLKPGMQALQAGNFDVAENVFRGVLSNDSSEIHSLHFLGVILCQKGYFDDGVALIEKSIQLESSRFGPYLNLGRVLVGVNQWDRAVAALQAAVQRDASSFDAWLLLAQASFSAGDTKTALVAGKTAVEINPGNAEILFLLGMYSSIDDRDSAIDYYRQAIAIDPAFYKAWVKLGNLLLDSESIEESILAYQEALVINPSCLESLTSLGEARFKNGEPIAAIDSYRTAIKVKPDFADSYFNLGVVLSEEREYEQAIVAYRKAIQVNSSFIDAYLNLGNNLKKVGKIDEAIAVFRKAIEVKPDFATAYLNLGNVLKEKGRIEEAIATFRKAIEVRPDFAVAYLNLGNAFKKNKNVEDAVECYRNAIELNCNYVDALSALASVLSKSEDYDEVVSLYKRALIVESGNMKSIVGLGQCFIKSGTSEEVISYYSERLRVAPFETASLFFLFEVVRGDIKEKMNQSFSYSGSFLHKSLKLAGVKSIVAFGDSHVNLFRDRDEIEVNWVGASTAYNLVKKISYTGGRQRVLNRTKRMNPEDEAVLLCFGEVDIRANIIKYCYLNGLSINDCVEDVVSRYVAFAEEISSQGFNVFIYGGYGAGGDMSSFGTDRERGYAAKCLNARLSELCKDNSFVYFSLHDAFFDADSLFTDSSCLYDGFHLYCDDNGSKTEIQLLLFERMYEAVKALGRIDVRGICSKLVLGNVGTVYPLNKGVLVADCLSWDEETDKLESIVIDLGAAIRFESISLKLDKDSGVGQLRVFLDGRPVDIQIVQESARGWQLCPAGQSAPFIGRYPMFKASSDLLLSIRGVSFKEQSLV